MNLPDLRTKLKRHYTSYKRQMRKYRNTGKTGHKMEAWTHLAPMKKLKALIAKLLSRRSIDWNGHPPLASNAAKKATRVALSIDGLYVTATTDGTHSATSWHYKGRAIDFGSNSGSEGPEIAAQQKLIRHFGSHYFRELFGPAPFYVKDGVKYSGVFPGHHDHLHLAV